MKVQNFEWKKQLFSAGTLTIFVALFYAANLFIACMALIGCLLVRWICVSKPSNKRTHAMEHIALGVSAVTIVLACIGGFYGSQKVKWPQWYVFGQSSKAATLAKEKPKAGEKEDGEWNALFLKSLNQIAENTGRVAAGQDEIKKAVEDARLEAEERFYSKKGREDAERDFEKGDTSKAKPMPETERTLPPIVLPEDIPGEAIPQTPVPKKKVEPKKPATPPEPEGERGPAKGFQLPTQEDAMPPAQAIPNSGPKEPTPELRAKVAPPEKKKGRPTFVICSCKNCEDHKHPITDWYDFDKNGVPEPVYDPCFYANTGKAACKFKDWAWEE